MANPAIIHLELQTHHVHRDHKRVLEIIHLELPVVVHVHHVRKVLVELELAHHLVPVDLVEIWVAEIWQDLVLVLSVLDLLRDHNNALMVHNDLAADHKVVKVAEDLVAHLHHLLIAHKVDHNVLAELAVNQVVVLHLEDQVNVLAQAAHLVKMPERKRITRVRKLVVKRSTICKLPHLAAQLSHAVMEILQLSYVAALRWRISRKKSVQIPQH